MNIVQITAETLPRYRQALAALMIDAEKKQYDFGIPTFAKGATVSGFRALFS